jgi:ribosome-binding protein aMBF1 (putative translation factor)
MKIKRIYRKNTDSPKKRAENKAIHEYYKEHPTTKEDLKNASSEFVNQQLFWQVMAFAKQLRDLREEQGLTLSTVSERCGIDKAVLSKLENGLTHNPTVGTLDRYLQALGKRLTLDISNIESRSTKAKPKKVRS